MRAVPGIARQNGPAALEADRRDIPVRTNRAAVDDIAPADDAKVAGGKFLVVAVGADEGLAVLIELDGRVTHDRHPPGCRRPCAADVTIKCLVAERGFADHTPQNEFSGGVCLSFAQLQPNNHPIWLGNRRA